MNQAIPHRTRGCPLPRPLPLVNLIPYILYSHFIFSPSAVAYRNEFDEPPRDDELLNMRRTSPPNHGILKVGSTSPNGQRHHSQADYDDGHMQII